MIGAGEKYVEDQTVIILKKVGQQNVGLSKKGVGQKDLTTKISNINSPMHPNPF